MVPRIFGLTLLPSGPARTIFEFAPRRVFWTATSMHHFLLRIYPAQTCFVYRNQCGLTAAKLLDLILCSFCLALSSVVSLSKLPWHIAAKAFLWVAPATVDCHQYLLVLLHPTTASCQACVQPCTGRASCAAPEECLWHVPFWGWLHWWWAKGGQISFTSPSPSSCPGNSWLPG